MPTRNFNRGEQVAPGRRVNLNKAGKEELRRLFGVGEDVATAIVYRRLRHGPFRRPEDVEQVPGLSRKWRERDAKGQFTI